MRLAFFAIIALWFSLASSVLAEEYVLPELDIERVRARGEFIPEPDRAYILVESRNNRSHIRFALMSDASESAVPTGWFETPNFQRFAGENDVSVWLFEVPVGNYALSSISWQWVPFDHDCACMGTVRFPVEPGQVTAIRAETALLDERGHQVAVGNMPRNVPGERRGESDLWSMRAISVGHPTSGIWRENLSDVHIEPARLTPMAEFPNLFGSMIARVLPIDGVLDYDGEQLIDLTVAE